MSHPPTYPSLTITMQARSYVHSTKAWTLTKAAAAERKQRKEKQPERKEDTPVTIKAGTRLPFYFVGSASLLPRSFSSDQYLLSHSRGKRGLSFHAPPPKPGERDEGSASQFALAAASPTGQLSSPAHTHSISTRKAGTKKVHTYRPS